MKEIKEKYQMLLDLELKQPKYDQYGEQEQWQKEIIQIYRQILIDLDYFVK